MYIPNAAVLQAIYKFIAPKESSNLSNLTPFDDDKTNTLNPSIQQLAYYFHVDQSNVS